MVKGSNILPSITKTHMKAFVETLRDGKCTVHAIIPTDREGLQEAIAEMPDNICAEIVERAVTHWWHHSAPRKEKGKDKAVAYGSKAEPLSFAEIMAIAAEATRRDSVPSAKDKEGAEEKLQLWRIDWKRANPANADSREDLDLAMRAKIEERAVELKAGAYPALSWQWNAENPCPVFNLAMLARALRLYKADSI